MCSALAHSRTPPRHYSRSPCTRDQSSRAGTGAPLRSRSLRRVRGGSRKLDSASASRAGISVWSRSASIRVRQWTRAARAPARRRSIANRRRESQSFRARMDARVPPDVGVVLRGRRRSLRRRPEVIEVIELRCHRRAGIAAKDHRPRARRPESSPNQNGEFGGERVDQRDVGANAVVGANRGPLVGHADVDVLATDRGAKNTP